MANSDWASQTGSGERPRAGQRRSLHRLGRHSSWNYQIRALILSLRLPCYILLLLLARLLHHRVAGVVGRCKGENYKGALLNNYPRTVTSARNSSSARQTQCEGEQRGAFNHSLSASPLILLHVCCCCCDSETLFVPCIIRWYYIIETVRGR